MGKLTMNGVNYVDVDGDVQIGDYYYSMVESIDITEGKLYKIVEIDVLGNGYFNDDVGDLRQSEARARCGDGVIVRKVSEVTGDIELSIQEAIDAAVAKKLTELGIAGETEDEPLKVGDYVVVHGRETGLGELSVGDVAKIREEDSLFDFTVIRLSDNTTESMDAGDLRRATDAEVAKARLSIEVGDFVKLSIPKGEHPSNGWGGVKNGDIGKVFYSRSDGLLSIEFPNHRNWGGYVSEVVKLSDAETEKIKEKEKWQSIGRNPGEFKPGDIVKAKETAKRHLRGRLVEVVGEPSGPLNGGNVAVELCGGTSISFGNNLELVAPVESLFAGGK